MVGVGIVIICVYRSQIKKKRQKQPEIKKKKQKQPDTTIYWTFHGSEHQGTDEEKKDLCNSDIEMKKQQGTDDETGKLHNLENEKENQQENHIAQIKKW